MDTQSAWKAEEPPLLGEEKPNELSAQDTFAKREEYRCCLLYTCYWIKRSIKPKANTDFNRTEIMNKMQLKRVDMAFKLLTATGENEESWGEFTNDDYLNTVAYDCGLD
ncbi:hypothetical protein C5167_030631 [Papaver somniferum]|nr:hypothetical protein C5167_030631 [Papaver somniferum]